MGDARPRAKSALGWDIPLASALDPRNECEGNNTREEATKNAKGNLGIENWGASFFGQLHPCTDEYTSHLYSNKRAELLHLWQVPTPDPAFVGRGKVVRSWSALF